MSIQEGGSANVSTGGELQRFRHWAALLTDTMPA
jgi:hypothetical protein